MPASQQKATRTSLRSQQRIEAHRPASEVHVVQIVTTQARTHLHVLMIAARKNRALDQDT
jgi:hypothetical protein